MAQFSSDEPAVRGESADKDGEGRIDYVELLLPVARHWRSLVSVVVVAGVLGTAYAFTLTPIFTARVLFIPPQQQGGGASAALAQLGALAGVAGIGGATKSTADQYVAMMQSVTVGDRMVDKFNLMSVYNAQFRDKARDVLGKSTSFAIGKKDGLITVAVDDVDPKRAAAMANQYVDELRRMTAVLAVSEAQGRRMFFEEKLKETKDRLTTAQIALQGSGFTEGALKAEPRAAAEGYAKLQAELTAGLVMLQTMRQSLADSSADVQRQLAKVAALREQLQAMGTSGGANGGGGQSDFVGKYREFKYQETLFDLMARQYELARVDEAREGALIQVVDPAQPPEHKSRPARLQFGLATAVVVGFAYALFLVLRGRFRANLADPRRAERWATLRSAFRRHR
jgi:uncharacterized protein involved in exopolysaccharide biosynthesis